MPIVLRLHFADFWGSKKLTMENHLGILGIWNIAWKLSEFNVFLFVSDFTTFGLNTEIYSVIFRIHSKCGKIRTRKTPISGNFQAVDINITGSNFSLSDVHVFSERMKNFVIKSFVLYHMNFISKYDVILLKKMKYLLVKFLQK